MTPVAMPTSAELAMELNPPAQLLLVRLLAASKLPPTPSLVYKSINGFFRKPPSAEEWQTTTQLLRMHGSIEPKKMLLTETGRIRAFDFLGVTPVIDRLDWKTIQKRFLLPKILKQQEYGIGEQAPLNHQILTVTLLKKRLSLSKGKTLKGVMNAMICRELGIAEAEDWELLRRELLSRMLGSETILTTKQIEKIFPLQKLNLAGRKLKDLQKIVYMDWTEPSAEPEVEETERFDLATFADTVRSAARHCPTGRFGDNKVFINHVWRYLSMESSVPKLDLPAFKEKLVEANTLQLLVLSRADMAPDMPQEDVRESETHYLNAHFHFITLE